MARNFFEILAYIILYARYSHYIATLSWKKNRQCLHRGPVWCYIKHVPPAAYSAKGRTIYIVYMNSGRYSQGGGSDIIIIIWNYPKPRLQNILETPGMLHNHQGWSLSEYAISWVALHWYWAIWTLTTTGAHALSYFGEFLIWRSIPNSPNYQN